MKAYPKQKCRAEILFREYPAIEDAYGVSMELTEIFNTKCNKSVALTKLARWYEKIGYDVWDMCNLKNARRSA